MLDVAPGLAVKERGGEMIMMGRRRRRGGGGGDDCGGAWTHAGERADRRWSMFIMARWGVLGTGW